MQEKLQLFARRVMSIEPPNINWLGRRLPGMAGGSAATQGAMSSGSDVTYRLKIKTTELLKAQNESDEKLGKQLAKEIEGLLMTESILSVLTKKEANTLVEMLHDSMKEEK